MFTRWSQPTRSLKQFWARWRQMPLVLWEKQDSGPATWAHGSSAEARNTFGAKTNWGMQSPTLILGRVAHSTEYQRRPSVVSESSADWDGAWEDSGDGECGNRSGGGGGWELRTSSPRVRTGRQSVRTASGSDRIKWFRNLLPGWSKSRTDWR